MHQDDGDPLTEDPSEGVNEQFGAQMRRSRESRGWSQRQLAEMLRAANLKLDPSAITRIERGTRDVKLSEAVAIASVLEFGFDSFSYSPVSDWMMREVSQVEMTIRARKALLQAIRQIDRWVNNSDADTEKLLMERRHLKSYVDLYTYAVRQSRAFLPGGSLGHGDGDNFAVYHDDDDRQVKQSIVEAVLSEILISEEKFDEYSNARRQSLGRGLATLIPAADGHADGQDT